MGLTSPWGLTEMVIVCLLLIWDRPLHALAVAGSLGLQFWAMRVMLRDPKAKARAARLQACGLPSLFFKSSSQAEPETRRRTVFYEIDVTDASEPKGNRPLLELGDGNTLRNLTITYLDTPG